MARKAADFGLLHRGASAEHGGVAVVALLGEGSFFGEGLPPEFSGDVVNLEQPAHRPIGFNLFEDKHGSDVSYEYGGVAAPFRKSG